MGSRFRDLLPKGRPCLALAPMQEVTDLPFWKVITGIGDPDVYYTEYFRVHADSKPEKYILRSIDENPTNKPVIAQMIGQDIPAMVRTAKTLERHAVSGIDVNLGCPAPVVCNKNAGGGLLRNPDHVDALIGALRSEIQGNLTIKTRVGFDSHLEFDRLLELFAAHPIDALSIHGRTVKEKYQTQIHFECIRKAVEALSIPVLANGNCVSVQTSKVTLDLTGASGLMIGRGAIRNPWIFRQLVAEWEGKDPIPMPTLSEVNGYVRSLVDQIIDPEATGAQAANKMKRYMNFIAPGVDADGTFLHEIRRVQNMADFKTVCDRYLNGDERMLPEPPASSLFAGQVTSAEQVS